MTSTVEEQCDSEGKLADKYKSQKRKVYTLHTTLPLLLLVQML